MRATYIDPEKASMDTTEIRLLLRQVEKDTLDFENGEIERQKKQFHAVRDWIAATETETEHNNICRDRNRYQNCGSWILERVQIKEWIYAKPDEYLGSVLWINGRPGAGKLAVALFRMIKILMTLISVLGKTYLASVLIEECLKQGDCTTCYYYCSENEAASRDSAKAILRGILLQLVCQHTELIPYCYAKMESSFSSSLSDLSTMNTLLETFCERISRLYVVIDGLDECGDGKKDLLETFKSLVEKAEVLSPGKIRVVFLSRPVPEIKNSLPNSQVLVLETENTKDDIQKYCQHRTRELVKFDLGDSILNDVVDRICFRADGKSGIHIHLEIELTFQVSFCSQNWS